MAELAGESELVWPPTWQGLKQQIVYLAQFGNSVQVIHGEPGAGKTTFFNHLLSRGFGNSAVGVDARQGTSLEGFFRSILTQLGLRPLEQATRGELIAALRGFVQNLHKERARAVLLIDSAHELSDPELGALLSLQQGHTDAGVGLHIIMFAEPGFAARLDALGLLDVTVNDAPLPPMSPAEIQQLLRRLAPRLGISLDATESSQRLWHQSRGLPGKVIDLAQQLQPTPVAEKVLSMRGLPIGHFAALVLLSAVLIWAFLVRTPEPSPQTEATALPIPSIQQPIEIPAAVETPPKPEAPIAEKPTPSEQTRSSEPAQIQTAAPGAEPASSTPNTSGANFDEQMPVEVERARQPARQDPVAPAAPPELPVATLKPAVSSDAISANEQELLRLPASGFALQLMATSTVEALRSYVERQSNSKNLRMYRSARNGTTLYIVVEGFYADKAAAQAAVVNLPEQQRKAGPWPKPLEQIHREIRANRSR